MPVWELAMEHRADVEGAVELPDTKAISQSVYEELGVDLFFSLWFVFLNNKEREIASCTRLFFLDQRSRSRPQVKKDLNHYMKISVKEEIMISLLKHQ